ELNRPDVATLVDEVERMSVAFDVQLKAWAASGVRAPLPRGLLQMGNAFRAARITLAKRVFVIAGRKLTADADLLPATNLHFPDELYLADIRLCCDRINGTVAKGEEG